MNILYNLGFTKKYLLISLIILLSFRLFPQKKEFTVDVITSGKEFRGKSIVAMQWFEEGNKFSFMKRNPLNNKIDIFQHDVKTGEESILVSSDDLKEKPEDQPFVITNYQWSPNNKYILFTGLLPARKVKSGGAFYIYDVQSKKFFVLAESDEQQMNALFSPDGNKLAFVRNSNVFVIDILTKKEKQLTFDGSEIILNGHFDWVYEEEFSIINGMEWSPNSKHIAFWRLDQSQEPIVKIQKYDSLHLNFLEMRYPKAGDKNAFVDIGVVNIEDAKTTWINLGEEKDIYIPRIKFTADENILSVQRLNRLQNKNELLFADVKTGKTKVVLIDSDSCWVDVFDELTFLKDKNRFIWLSEKDGFAHLYMYNYKGELLSQITKGEYEVISINAVDEQNEKVYYSSNERGTIYKDLYSINFNGTGKKRLTEQAGYNDANFSPNNKWFTLRYSNSNTVASTTIYNTQAEKIRDLILPDMTAFKDYNFLHSEFIKIKTSDNVELNAMIIKPADFDPNKKYPLLFEVYGGPGSQTVVDQWRGGNLWAQLLANKGYIYISVDNRGTSGRGKLFKNLVYKNLGQWEVKDYTETVKHLSTLSYVDLNRIGIWGWSYGGYASLITLMNSSEYFKAAIAIAPVTDWRFYDNIYTERYMSLPSLNNDGYENACVMNCADKLRGKLLLVHGTADDNVHFQNSVKLVDKLVELNKPFETMFYPEKDHGIYGGKTRTHLYNMMTEFILKEL
jgi:dipeptidyl-peptidase-4